MKVLHVDDDIDALRQSELFLKQEIRNLNIESVTSAEKALKMLQMEKYDAVVSEYQMGEMDGIELMGTLRGKKNGDVLFIMSADASRDEAAVETRNLGADQYIRKGGDPESQQDVLAQAIIREVERHRTEEEFNELFNSINDAVFVHDLEGNSFAVNDEAAKRFGYSEEELGSMDTQAIGRGKHAFLEEELAKKIEKRANLIFETVLVIKDGGRIPLKVNFSLIDYKGQPAVLSVARDISERKKAEKKYAFESNLLNSLLNNADDFVYL